MNKRTELPAMVIAVAILAVIVIGEAVVYTSDYTDYSADASLEDGTLNYSVSADGSKEYSVVVSDNGGFTGIRTLYLYYDESYPSDYEAVDSDVGAPTFNQKYYLEQVANLLEYRGVQDVRFVNAQELKEVLGADIESEGCSGKGLVVVSGVLPDTVYEGNQDDVIMRWISSGGSLYWAGNTLGSSYATQDGIEPVDSDYQEMFFGGDCLYTGDDTEAYSEVSNGYTKGLSLMNNDVRYGIDSTKVGSDRACLTMGFVNDAGYASIGMVQCGQGMVCVFGGQLSNMQRYDMAQVIASGIGPSSQLITVETGSVTRGTVTGSIDGITGTGVSAYIYLGGYYPVYGKLFGF